ncbi:PrgI family protein [Clostridiaceae bacterium]|nr:PrgI family protein [Clostridiaceae bacterium]
MEVKINKEIRNYTESMFFGLSMRQFLFSVLACGVAVGLFFLLRGRFGMETVSWMCVLGASPFAVMGFVKYNGMTAEQFVWAWIKSEFILPKKMLFVPENLYYEAVKNAIEAHAKGTPVVQKKRKKRKHRAKRRKEARKRRKQAEKAKKKNEKARKRKEADYD